LITDESMKGAGMVEESGANVDEDSTGGATVVEFPPQNVFGELDPEVARRLLAIIDAVVTERFLAAKWLKARGRHEDARGIERCEHLRAENAPESDKV
jgi:hypothetical protein